MIEARTARLAHVEVPRRVVYFVKNAEGSEDPKLGVLTHKGAEAAEMIALKGLRAGGTFSLPLETQVIDLGTERIVKGPGNHPITPGIKP